TVINGDFSKQLQFESLGNQIYIPESFLSKDSKARVEFEFKQESGTIMLELFNGYKSKIANEYLRYEILVNDNIVMYEDMSKWNLPNRSEEHTSELQSRFDLVCRLLLDKKN